MAIKVRCKSCQAVLRTKDTMAGKVVKCPHCGEKLRIPGAGGTESPSRSSRSGRPQRSEQPRRRRRSQNADAYDAEDMGGADDFDFGGLDPNAGVAVARPDRKPCAACGELIQKKAAKCRFCGEIFDPALKRRKNKSRKRSRSRYSDDEDLETIEWLLVIFLGGIACILGIVYLIQGRTSKGYKLIGYTLGIRLVLGLIFALFAALAGGN
ncbi:MAG: hypothetical protein KDA84_11015 [Planctomycetaceae bacterium]|nr:hypothetical protein [Planctomycetaceae bacterium]